MSELNTNQVKEEFRKNYQKFPMYILLPKKHIYIQSISIIQTQKKNLILS